MEHRGRLILPLFILVAITIIALSVAAVYTTPVVGAMLALYSRLGHQQAGLEYANMKKIPIMKTNPFMASLSNSTNASQISGAIQNNGSTLSLVSKAVNAFRVMDQEAKPFLNSSKEWKSHPSTFEYEEVLRQYVETTAQKPGPAVIYVCASRRCAGLADRLLGMTSLINLCIIDDIPFKIGPQAGGLESDLLPNKIPWRVTQKEVDKQCSTKLSWSYYTPLAEVRRDWARYAGSGSINTSFCVQVNQVFDPRDVAVNRTDDSVRRGQAMSVFQNKTRGSFSGIESIAQPVVQSLFTFSPAVKGSLEEVKDSVNFSTVEHLVAIHIRDMQTEYKLGEDGIISEDFIQLALKCSERIETEYHLPPETTGWLFLSDRMVNVTDDIRSKYGSKLKVVYDLGRKGVKKPGNTARARGVARAHANFYALRDVALLTEEKIRVIGRTDGGFARLAALFGSKPIFECGMPGNRKQSNMIKR